MARYIDAECAKSIYLPTDVWSLIDRVPTADVQPVVHSHWIWLGATVYTCDRCSNTFEIQYDDDITNYKYCPYCMATMDEETDL